jgi:hypothetical protein
VSGDAPLVGIPEDMPRLLESGPDLPDELIDRILDGQPVDASAPLEAHLLAGWVATLRSAAQQSELRGERSAVAAFLWAKRFSPERGSSQRQLHPSVRKGIAGAAIVGAISAGGVVAAATGSLPAPLQVVAHVLLGVHPPPADDSGGEEPTSSDFASPLPADVLKPIPNRPPSVGTTTPSASPDPASGQPDVVGETDALAPAATDTYSTASQPETAAAHEPSTPPESPGGPPAGVEPNGAPPELPGGPPAGVEPNGGPPESPGGPPAGVEPNGGPPESPGGPPAAVEPNGAPPESPGGPPAAAVDRSQAPTGMVEQPGAE